MTLGICPTVDFAFKLMLGSPEHTKITIHFLNAVLEGQQRITEVTDNRRKCVPCVSG
ncbi:MAG: PD-(D/E)XK nuclease family transposase [Planctomycetaceae bacterium]|nr:PD-(D/E)XK nuclease family transposase [Planctomycetaceae bacterium]